MEQEKTSEQVIAELQRELIGIQEMLAMILKSLGNPVMVTKETLRDGLPEGTEIRIDEDMETESFIFSLAVPDGV